MPALNEADWLRLRPGPDHSFPKLFGLFLADETELVPPECPCRTCLFLMRTGGATFRLRQGYGGQAVLPRECSEKK